MALFVYGTLKYGFDAHDRLCTDVGDIAYGATVRGNLYELPQGYPALVTHDEDVLARASTDPHHDALVQADIPGSETPSRPPARNIVHGQLLYLQNPRDIRALDEYEGCVPGDDGLYDRVLLPAATISGVVAAWTYAMRSATGVHLPGGTWPREGRQS